MRWKLLIITSLVAALLSAGGLYVFTYVMNVYLTPASGQLPRIAGLLIIPLAIATLASIFVYRHTARRRKLQAALTALLSLILTLTTIFTLAAIAFSTMEVRARPSAAPFRRGLT